MKKQMQVLTFILAAAGLPLISAEHAAITSEQGDAILAELREIRVLLQKSAAPAARQPENPMPSAVAKLKIGAEPILGRKDAPLTMVEFTDTRCGYCKQFHATAFPEILKNLIDTGKVRFVSRDLPLDVSSPSLRAAETIRCAGEQDKYWPLRHALMTTRMSVTNESIAEESKALGLDMPKLNACVESGKYRAAIENDIREASGLNIGGTPTFVIGKTTPEGVDGVTVVGALPYAAFEAKFREFAEK